MSYGDEWERERDLIWRRYADASWIREQEEDDLHPDDRLDEIGWDIFLCCIFRGQTVDEAARQGLDGNYRQRLRVRDDMYENLRRTNQQRFQELRPNAFQWWSDDTEAEEQLGYWSARLTSPEYVYFIQEGGLGPVKIGYSNAPLRRVGELQTGNPDELVLRHVIPGNRQTEAVLHRRFEPARIRPGGEWFGNVTDADYLAIILAFASGLANTMLHAHDGREHPPLMVAGAHVRTVSEIHQIRADVARLWQRGHDLDAVAQILRLDSDEVKFHFEQIRGDRLYSLPRSNHPPTVYRYFKRPRRPAA